jgi:sterol desaturase/sphingolipid hydroxylase (fatty acid hydroxylase superfamily)
MLYLIVLIMSFLVLTNLGYWMHYAFHQKWSGRLYQAHCRHHNILYPSNDFMSDEYRDPKQDNTFYLFALCFSPLVLTAVLLTVFGVIPLLIGIEVLAMMAIVGAANNYMHDAFHIYGTWWNGFWFFDKLRHLHYMHHIRQDKNFGIFNFLWDRVFGTYVD